MSNPPLNIATDFCRKYQRLQEELRLANTNKLQTVKRGFPCSLKARKILDYPLVMAAILQKNSPKCELQIYFEQNQREYLTRKPMHLSSKTTKKNQSIDTSQLMLRSTRVQLFPPTPENRYRRQASLQPNKDNSLANIEQEIQKPKTPNSYIKAQLYFSKQLKDGLRTPNQRHNKTELFASQHRELMIRNQQQQ